MDQVGSAVHPSFELLSAYHDAEASSAEVARVPAHLDRCAVCRRQLAGFDLLSMSLAGTPALGCASARPLLSAQLDGETTREEAAIATAHLASCAPCRATRAGWQGLDLALATLPSGVPSAVADARIRGLVHKRRLIPTGPAMGGGIFGRGLVAALAMLIAVVATIPRGASPSSTEQVVGIGQDTALVAAVQQVLNPRTNTLYVLEPARAVVVAKNATTNEPIAQISVGGRPTALALNEETNVVYVLDPSAKTYTEISGTTNTVTARVSVPLSGNPTTIDVNTKTGEVVIAATPANAQPSTFPGGQLAVINPTTKKIDVRQVDVAPTQVVLDATGGRLFLLGAKSTSVIDAKTFQTVATLPSAVSVAASAIGGATALLTSDSGKALLSFYGAATRATFEGTPVSVIGLPDGSFAVLLDRGGSTGQIALVAADGTTLGSLDVLGTTRALTYDPETQRFLGASGQSVATIGNHAVAAVTPAPASSDRPAPNAPATTPTATPSASTSPTAPSAPVNLAKPAIPSPSQVTAPAGVIPGSTVATGAFSRLDVGLGPGTFLIAEGARLWALAPDGAVSAIDTTTGIASRVATIGHASALAVTGGRFYAMDPATATLWSVDARNGQVRTWPVPFGGTVAGIAASGDGRVWLAPLGYAGLVQLDPRTGAFTLLALPAGATPTAVAVDRAGTIWYADAGRGVIGSYEPSLRRFTEQRSPTRAPIRSITVESSGQVWFAAANGDVFTATGASVGLARPVGTSIGASASGPAASWFVSADGLLAGRLAGGSPLAGPAQAVGIALDPTGRVWLSSSATGALFILDPR
ncbi:MAG: hypothetical protein NVS9B6_09600 [Candidatus Limnocylindrales bacterium]